MEFHRSMTEDQIKEFKESLSNSVGTFVDLLNDKIIFPTNFPGISSPAYSIHGKDGGMYCQLVTFGNPAFENTWLDIVTQYWAQDQVMLRMDNEELEKIATNMEAVKNFLKMLDSE